MSNEASFSYEENVLYINKPSVKKVEFDYKINQVVLAGDVIVVILKNSKEYVSRQNVYGVDLNGNLIWQIAEPTYPMSFANIYWHNNELYARNSTDYKYHINPKTGEVFKQEFVNGPLHFYFEGNLLYITKPTSSVVEFEYKIFQVMLAEETLVVILKNSESYSNRRNVYGVDLNGDIIWQIAEPKHPMCYSNIYWHNNEFYAGHYRGYEYHINPKTGEVIKIVFRG